MVLEAFLGPPPDNYHGCHKNGDRLDNRLANLRWDTPAGNALDNIENGTRRLGKQLSWTKLNEVAVLEIRQALKNGASRKMLAAAYGVHPDTVRDIENRRSWRWL